MSLAVSNIFLVGNEDNPEQAAEDELRADLMLVLTSIIREQGWTQQEAGKRFGLNQPQVSALLNWRIEKFTSQRLYRCLAKLGFSIKPTYEAGSLGVEVRQAEAICH